MGAFDYTTNGVTMPPHSCMSVWGLGKGGHELTHNTPKYLQTCHKINNSIVPYKRDISQNSYFIIDEYPKCYNKYIIQNKNEYYDE